MMLWFPRKASELIDILGRSPDHSKMNACATKARWRLGGQLLALLAAATWALLPALCSGGPRAESEFASAISQSAHGASHDHPDDKGDSCCHVVAAAKVVAPAVAPLPAVQIVLVSPSLGQVAPVAELRSPHPKLVRDSTGPPPPDSSKYFSYSPLAPPLAA